MGELLARKSTTKTDSQSPRVQRSVELKEAGILVQNTWYILRQCASPYPVFTDASTQPLMLHRAIGSGSLVMMAGAAGRVRQQHIPFGWQKSFLYHPLPGYISHYLWSSHPKKFSFLLEQSHSVALHYLTTHTFFNQSIMVIIHSSFVTAAVLFTLSMFSMAGMLYLLALLR
jgi:hypothetical protein